MRAQNHAAAVRLLAEIKGVVLLPRRMLGRNVERREIVEIILDMRAFGHGKSEIAENLHHFFPHLGNGMHRAARLGAAGKVTSIFSDARRCSSCASCSTALRAAIASVTLSFKTLSAAPAVLRSSGPMAPRDFICSEMEPFLPSVATRNSFERRFIGSACHLLQDILFETHGNFGP